MRRLTAVGFVLVFFSVPLMAVDGDGAQYLGGTMPLADKFLRCHTPICFQLALFWSTNF
jgi:hypothetical protein